MPGGRTSAVHSHRGYSQSGKLKDRIGAVISHKSNSGLTAGLRVVLERPLPAWILRDGAALRSRFVIVAAAVTGGVALAMTAEIPTLLGTPVPALAPLTLAVILALGSIDALAGAAGLAAHIAVVGLLRLPTSEGLVVPVAGLLGQSIVLGLLVVMTPLLARSLSYIIGLAALSRRTRRLTFAKVLRFTVGPYGQGLLSGILIALLAFLWFGGATALLASMLPRAGVLDIGPIDGAGVATAAAFLGAVVRLGLTDPGRIRTAVDRATADRARQSQRRVRSTATARIARLSSTIGSTALLLVLVSSLFSGELDQLIIVGVLVVAIRSIREGLIPEPVALLGPRARDALRNVSGAIIFVVVTFIAVIAAFIAGTDIGRIRVGYFVLLSIVLVLTRRSDAVRSSPKRASRASATTVLIAGLATAALGSSPLVQDALAQTSQEPSIPGLIGATSTLTYSLTHAYPAELFVPEGEEPEDDEPVERTTSYAVTVTVTDAVSFGPGFIGMEVDLNGTMAPWEGGDCDAAPFHVEVILAESESAIDAYVETVHDDPTALQPGSAETSELIFLSRVVDVDCGAFSRTGIRVVDRWNRMPTTSTGVLAAFHPRSLDVPTEIEMSKDVTVVNLTPVAAPVADTSPEAPSGTSDAADGAEESETSTSDPPQIDNSAEDSAGSNDPGTPSASPDPEAATESDLATSDDEPVPSADDSGGPDSVATAGVDRAEVSLALPTPATPLPAPPLIALAAPAMLVSVAGIAGAAGVAGITGLAGVAGAAGAASAAGAAGGAAGQALGGGIGQTGASSFNQAGDGSTIGGRDLRPIVGLPDVDLQQFLEDGENSDST